MPEPSSSDRADLRGLVERTCAELGLNEFAANTVEEWVKSAPDTWGTCCMGGCDPCNDTLRAAARAVLAALDADPRRP